MAGQEIAVAVLLAGGVASAAIAALGVAVARNPVDRLHFGGAATSAGSILIGLAVVVDGLAARPAAELAVVVVVLFVGGPLVSHALARAFRIRALGRWDAETGVIDAQERMRS